VERIVRYVCEQTGQYHDKELSEVLQAAIGRPVPKGYPTFKSTEALKMWRTDRGLTAAPKRKSKSPKS
jgi:hypothetical protein